MSFKDKLYDRLTRERIIVEDFQVKLIVGLGKGMMKETGATEDEVLDEYLKRLREAQKERD